MILVTGATGSNGTEILKLLAAQNVWQADGLLEEYAHYRRNEAAEIGSGVKEAISKEPRNFETFVHDYASMFNS